MKISSEFNIINHSFPKTQYYIEETEKSQAVLHHTLSGDNIDGDINWWKQTPERVATCVIISRNGDIHTLFSSKHWAHHLGVKMAVFKKAGLSPYGANKKLNKSSLGIELDSWGGLVNHGGRFFHGKNEVEAKNVIDYGRHVRGFRYYEKYTDAQIDSTKFILRHWNKKYGIPLDYKPEMWEFSINALKGEPGVWSHVSFRTDKEDCHPQPELIEMLKSL